MPSSLQTDPRNFLINPKTEPQWRNVLGAIKKALRLDREDIDALLGAIGTLAEQTAEADVAVSVGDVLRISSVGHVTLADATALATADVCGMAASSASPGAQVTYRPVGVVVKDAWGLTTGSTYYLSGATAGLIVTAPDQVSAGNVSIIVGRALSTTEFLFNPSQPLVL